MKYYTPKLATAILAAAAMMGGSQHAATEYTLRPTPDMGDSNQLDKYSSRAHRRKGRVAQNQRQRRLDRRRAWAAGNRRAFR